MLAVFGDKPNQTTSLLASIERLAAYVTNNEVTKLIPISESEREVVKERYQRQRQAKPAEITPSSTAAQEFWFYLSYARSDDVNFIQKFFTDLSNEVRVRLGIEPTRQIGFLDSESTLLGQDFNESRIFALENSRLLVALCSPSYFKSAFCGKEFQFFIEQKEVTDPDRNLSTILPITWIPSADMPPAAAQVQQEFGSPKGGVRQLIKSSKRSDEYAEVIEKAAARLVEMAQQLPRLSFRKKPELIGIRSAFETQPVPRAITDRAVRQVNFIYVVGEKEELAPIRDNVSSYGSTSDDWRPFHGIDKPIGMISQEQAMHLGLVSSVMPLNAEINKLVRQAEQDNVIVILIIDAWTLLVPRVNEILRTFDRYSFINCGIVSVMNERDRETVSMRDQLVTTLRTTFPFQTIGANDLLTEVGTEEEFRSGLSRYFSELTGRMAERSRGLY